MFILPKAIYRLIAIPIKIPVAYFVELGKTILKFICKYPGIAKVTVRENNNNNKARGITLPDLQ